MRGACGAGSKYDAEEKVGVSPDACSSVADKGKVGQLAVCLFVLKNSYEHPLMLALSTLIIHRLPDYSLIRHQTHFVNFKSQFVL